MVTRRTPSQPSTSSARAAKSAPRQARPSRTAHKPLQPFTVDHFRRYAGLLKLDNGEFWVPEDFQLEFAADVFSGVPELWLVVPEGNGKTTLLSGIALYHGDYTPSPTVLLGARSRDQCGLLLGQSIGFVRRSPGFGDRFRCYEGYRKIGCLRTGGTIQVYASDEATGDGVIPTLALLDELHRHKSLTLYRTWLGKLPKRGGQLIAISTAGEPGSEFEEARRSFRLGSPDVTRKRNGRHIRAASRLAVLHDFALTDDDDPDDLSAVKDANPFSGITEAVLRDKRESPTFKASHWRRMVCNVATRTEAVAVGEAEWFGAEVERELARGVLCDCLGLDIGWKWDCTALAPWFPIDEGLLLGRSTIITPPRDNNSLDPSEIRDAIEELHDLHPIRQVAMDITAANEIAHWLEHELDIQVVEVNQKTPSKAACAGSFLEGLRTGRLKHVNDPEMTRHVMNAVAKDLGDGSVKFVRPRASRTVDDEEQQRRVIDGLDAAAMGYFVAASGAAAYDGPLFEILT